MSYLEKDIILTYYNLSKNRGQGGVETFHFRRLRSLGTHQTEDLGTGGSNPPLGT